MTDDADKPHAGLEAVRLVFAQATPVETAHEEAPGDVAPSRQHDTPPEAAAPPSPPEGKVGTGLPPDCPVVALGKLGQTFFYIDANQQLIDYTQRDHSLLGVLALFGEHTAYLYQHWPRTSKRRTADGEEFEVIGWQSKEAAEALMAACGRHGIWSPQGRVRGRGGWLGDGGELVLHCGDTIAVSGPPGEDLPTAREPKYEAPGLVGRHIYPAQAPIARPAEAPAGPEVACELLDVLGTWSWQRPAIDPQFLLGFIGAMILGGALDWRPLCWITGEPGTGKSTLHRLFDGILGDQAIIRSSDTTAAGVYQALGYSSLPVEIDELEAEADGRKSEAVIKLARKAASGGVVLRGSDSHRGQDFTARSCFLFSSIVVPPLTPAERSRMLLLELDELAGATPPDMTPTRLEAMGRALRRRLLDGWPRFRQTLEAYREQAVTMGHGGRGADQWGTLGACADLLLYDAPPDGDSLGAWGRQLARMTVVEGGEDVPDWRQCLDHLLTQQLDAGRGAPRRLVENLIAEAGAELGGLGEANALLGAWGLQVVEADGRKWLAVTRTHTMLAQLFQGTAWAGRPGASRPWVQAARRVPGSVVSRRRFASRNVHCVLLPLEVVTGDDVHAPAGVDGVTIE